MSKEREEAGFECFETKTRSLESGSREVVSILRQESNIGLGPHHGRIG